MLIDSKGAAKRLESPNNLMNRLKAIRDKKSDIEVIPARETSRTELIPAPAYNPFSKTKIVGIPPTADELIDNLDNKLLYGQAHEKALNLLVDSLSILNQKLPTVNRVATISRIAVDMNSILGKINETQLGKKMGNQVQVNIYAPQYREVSEYEVIDLVE